VDISRRHGRSEGTDRFGRNPGHAAVIAGARVGAYKCVPKKNRYFLPCERSLNNFLVCWPWQSRGGQCLPVV
jgi:hypothetical protein